MTLTYSALSEVGPIVVYRGMADQKAVDFVVLNNKIKVKKFHYKNCFY